MTEKPSGPAREFDLKRLHYLARLMKRYDVTALDVSDDSVQIRLRRSSPHAPLTGTVGPAPALAALTPFPAPQAPPPAARPETPAVPSAPASTALVIESPMVGTYYSSSAPDSPPFVSVGSVVQASTIVCIIEAMKVFTDIPAGVSGTVAEILVKNGQAVEFGQPLFRVIPA